jgi:probable HAF family extracellular repeat protein
MRAAVSSAMAAVMCRHRGAQYSICHLRRCHRQIPPLPALDDPLATGFTVAYGINNAGQIVGEYQNAHGFLLSGGVYTTFDDPLATLGTSAYGINDMGQIVGDYSDAGGVSHGFIRSSSGTFQTLDPSGSTDTFARGINSTGQVVGFYSINGGPFHGFFYSGGTFTTLDDPLG